MHLIKETFLLLEKQTFAPNSVYSVQTGDVLIDGMSHNNVTNMYQLASSMYDATFLL